MILSFIFHHSNGFIHEPVTLSPRFKNPDTHVISAEINTLEEKLMVRIIPTQTLPGVYG